MTAPDSAVGAPPSVRAAADAPRPMRVAVLLGGSSEERGVSLASGCEVAAALRSRGHDVVAVDPAAGALSAGEERRILAAGIGRAKLPLAPPSDPNVLPEARIVARAPERVPELDRVEVVFPALHGGAGEDGTVQSLLQMVGIAYAGSGPLGCALAMDKDVTKRLLRDAGVPTPEWITGRASGEEVVARLGSPVIVKPASGGSSVRLTLAHTPAEVEAAAELAAGGGDEVLHERYVRGREFTVGVLGDETLPVVEIEPVRELFDFDCKYEPGMAIETAPARIPEETSAALRATALNVHRLLRLEHFSRVDFMMDEAGRMWCLEANALPGLTGNSLLPKAARAAGLEFPELCERICVLGRERGAGRRARTGAEP